MIQQATGLSGTALEAICDLERRVVATDGGRLKLEWGELRNRPDDQVRDLLWWEDGRLLGFLGLYGRGQRPLELTGMVDFTVRRRGIGTALFEAALPICRDQGDKLLMVVPRNSAGGSEFARSFGMTYEHSEHALRLAALPPDAPVDRGLNLRQATAEDIPVLSHLYEDGFHDGGHVDESRLKSDRSRTLLIELSGEPVGTIVQAREGARGAIYGFVVESGRRGRGIGRQSLRAACSELFAAGAEYVDLEVEVENDSALGLYTSVGFTLVATDDYFELLLK